MNGNSTFIEILEAVQKALICDFDKFGSIKAIYAKTPEDLKLIALYFSKAKSSAYHKVIFEHSEFKGPDWYFPVYEPGDSYCPGYAFLETLTNRKREFEVMCKYYNDILKGGQK